MIAATKEYINMNSVGKVFVNSSASIFVPKHFAFDLLHSISLFRFQ